jgi:hypothetical protein
MRGLMVEWFDRRGVDLRFPKIRNSENQQSLQRFHIALDDEGLLLL